MVRVLFAPTPQNLGPVLGAVGFSYLGWNDDVTIFVVTQMGFPKFEVFLECDNLVWRVIDPVSIDEYPLYISIDPRLESSIYLGQEVNGLGVNQCGMHWHDNSFQ